MTLHLAFTNFSSENIKLASLKTPRYIFFTSENVTSLPKEYTF